MKPETLHDKAEIETFLRRDPYLHLYAIGDLDAFFFRYTTWYALRGSDGSVRELIQIYSGLEPPILLALSSHPEQLRQLLTTARSLLPARMYGLLTIDVVTALEPDYRAESYGRHCRMGLLHPECVSRVDTSEAAALTVAHGAEVQQFFHAAYPGNWFDTNVLATGHYFGVRRGGALVSVAGVHTASIQHRAAALGNITTAEAYRGQGLATVVTAAVCQSLLPSIDLIGLNVKADNAPAIAVYQKLGFEIVGEYDEFMLQATCQTND